MKPAMKPGEWEDRETLWPVVSWTSGPEGQVTVSSRPEDDPPLGSFVRVDNHYRHALAAACLHGMPYGFTLLDVETLRHAAEAVEREALGQSNVYPAALEPVIRLRDLADRIEALLPPVSEGSPPTP